MNTKGREGAVPVVPPGPTPALSGSDANVVRLRPLRALLHVELDLLSVSKGPHAGTLDRRLMAKYVLAAAIRRDESEALRFVEPLYGAGCHLTCLFRARRHFASRPGALWREP